MVWPSQMVTRAERSVWRRESDLHIVCGRYVPSDLREFRPSPCHEDEIESGSRKLSGDGFADAGRCASDDGPAAVTGLEFGFLRQIHDDLVSWNEKGAAFEKLAFATGH